MKSVTTVLGQVASARPIHLWALFTPYKRALVTGLLLLLGTNAATLTLPRLVNAAVSLIEHGQETAVELLGVTWMRTRSVESLVACICVLACLGAVIRTLSRRVLFDVGRGVERDVRDRLFAHLSVLSPTFYQRNSVGDLLSRLTNDINHIRLFAGFVLLNALNLIIVFAATIPILFAIDPVVALCALLPFPLVILCARALAGRMSSCVKEQQESLGQLTARVQENLSGIHVVRAFGQETAEVAKFDRDNDRAYRAALALATLRIFTFPFMRAVSGLGVAVTLFVGGRAVVFGRITLGDFVEVNARLLQLAWPAISLGLIAAMFHQAKASVQRLNGVLAAPPDIVDGPHRGETVLPLRVVSLTVNVPGREEPVLRDIQLELARGQTIAVVGQSGQGKSTLVRALHRGLVIPRDAVFFGGMDASDWHLLSLLRRVAVVPQESFLFSASVRDNIAFGRPDAPSSEIAKVVREVGLEPDIATLPQGLETLVGERGVMLSGGQRQRVALARALLLRPQILLLDDCLSAVDADTEARIVDVLRQGEWAGSVLIATHRLSAVRHAHEILVLENGAVQARGSHDLLLQHSDLYRALWGMEQAGRALDEE